MKNIVKRIAITAIMLPLLNSNKNLANNETGNLAFQGIKNLISFVRSYPKTTFALGGAVVASAGLAATNTVDALPDNNGETKQQQDEKKEILVTSHGFSRTRNMYTFFYSKNVGINLPFLRRFPLWKRKRYITSGPIKTFNYDDVLFGLPIALWKTSLGQYQDMKKYADKCKESLDEGFEEINGHGISRGAAELAILAMTNEKLFEKEKKLKKIKNDNFNYEKLKEIRKHLKTVVIESPFDRAERVFANHILIKGLSTVFFTSPKKLYQLIQKITNYKDKGIQPIECARNMAKDSKKIGKLVVLSREDILVTPDATVRLAIEMCKNDPKNTHVLILDHGKHGNLLNGSDGQMYQNVMHAFYEKYEARYNKEFAAKGQQHFKKCKPGVRKLKKLLLQLEKNKKQQST